MPEPEPPYALETWTIHAGVDPADPTGALVPAIYPSTAYARQRLDEPGEYTYSRRSNPTRAALEQVLARLHGAQHAAAFGSGMAAVTAVGQLLKAGSHVLLPDDVYGNTHRLYTLILPDQDVTVDFVDYTDLAAVAQAIRPATRMLWIETPTNPTQNIVDLAAVTELGHRHGLLVAVDNSWLSPYFQQPLHFGVDLVVESTTKYLNGHDDVMGGAVLTNDRAVGERLAFLQYVGGAVPSPFDCWLLLRGLKTLAVRMDRHQANAVAVARFLQQHPAVEHVYYPGLPDHPGYAIAQRQMRGAGGMVSFEVRGDRDAARKVAERTRLFRLAAGFGGVESLIAHPLTMTHASQVGLDIAPSERLLRLSVGIEAAADLLADLEHALAGAIPFAAMPQVQVPGFLPSTRGLHFCNYYPHEPEIQIKIPLGPTLALGDAANGLCGGMAFTVRDFYDANQPVPPDTDPPPAGTPLYRFIVQRLMDSFNLPLGIGRYLELMQPAFPDVGLGFGLPGRASVMVRDEWPHIKTDLDAGRLVPLGLVKVKSSNPSDLCKNHQVLAYGYDLNGTDLTVWVYDPNYPNNDAVTLQLSIASIQVPVPVTYTPVDPEGVCCFFRTPYSPKQPPVR